jgi:small subunit ribosomal protein S16
MQPAEIRLNEEVALKWLNNGAIPSDTVKNLFKEAGIMKKFADSKTKKESK